MSPLLTDLVRVHRCWAALLITGGHPHALWHDFGKRRSLEKGSCSSHYVGTSLRAIPGYWHCHCGLSEAVGVVPLGNLRLLALSLWVLEWGVLVFHWEYSHGACASSQLEAMWGQFCASVSPTLVLVPSRQNTVNDLVTGASMTDGCVLNAPGTPFSLLWGDNDWCFASVMHHIPQHFSPVTHYTPQHLAQSWQALSCGPWVGGWVGLACLPSEASVAFSSPVCSLTPLGQ